MHKFKYKSFRSWKKRTSLTKKVARIRKLVVSEIMIFDTNALSNPTSTGQVENVCLIGEGNAVNQRHGLQIRATKIKFRCRMNIHATPVDSSIRFILLCDKEQVSATNPTVLQVLNENTIDSMYERTLLKRFRILYDRVVTLSKDGGYSAAFISKTKKVSIPLRWSASTTTSIVKNGIYLLLISNEAANTPTLDWSFRLFYRDN